MASVGKRKKKVLTFDEKLEVVRRIEENERPAVVAKHFGIAVSTAHEIHRNKQQLFDFCSSSLVNEDMAKHRRAMKKPAYELIEKCIHTWYLQERVRGVSISGPMITAKAQYFNRILYGENSKFKASSGWLFRFKQRFGILHLHARLDLSSIMQKDITSFKERLKGLVRQHHLSKSQIYYACEVRLLWKSLPDKVVEAIGGVAAKGKVTFLLCVNGTGVHKLPLLVIANPSNPTSPLDTDDLPSRLVSTEESCLDPVILKNWFINGFIPAVKAKHTENNGKQDIVLILESSPAHPFSPFEFSTGDDSIRAIFLPPNCINKKLSLSTAIPLIFKRDYRLAQIKKMFDNSQDFLQCEQYLNLETALKLSVDVWSLVKEDLLARQWQEFFSNMSIIFENESCEDLEDDITFNAIIESILDIFSKYPSLGQLTSDNIKDWIEKVDSFLLFPLLGDDEIIDKVKREVDSTSVIAPPKKRQRVNLSHEDAVKHFDKCIRWLKEQDNYDESDLCVLRKLKLKARSASKLPQPVVLPFETDVSLPGDVSELVPDENQDHADYDTDDISILLKHKGNSSTGDVSIPPTIEIDSPEIVIFLEAKQLDSNPIIPVTLCSVEESLKVLKEEAGQL